MPFGDASDAAPSRREDRLVMKFGGTSVGDIERIERVARHVMHAVETEGVVPVVNVSAMAGETNRLVDLAVRAGGEGVVRQADYDTIVSTGEQVTAGLLALVLQRHGFKARSWLSWQFGFETDDSYGAAAIHRIDREGHLGASLDAGEIAVVAGFQGISGEGRTTTLGRGGSDTSAVAIAAALKAKRCDIYTDVDGIYTSDPRVVSAARRLDRISFEEMLEMAAQGAKVLQTRSVGLAMTHGVPVRVLSSLNEPGESGASTLIVDENELLERRIVSAVVPSRAEARISLVGVPNVPGRSGAIFKVLGDAKINIDMIVQSQSRTDEAANLSFTLPATELSRAQGLLAEEKERIGFEDMLADQNVSKVSIIGAGMTERTGVAAQMFEALGRRGINIHNISTSEIKISALVPADYTELAVRTLHEEFGLASDDSVD